ncbi:MAG: TadE/TadG family type IV pilus assembly protein [Myxococcota bacterium]
MCLHLFGTDYTLSSSKTVRARVRKRLRGQSTVEFMLMIPVLMSIYFFVLEMGLWFTTIHYGNYAAFSIARAQQVGFSNLYPSVSSLNDIILTGAVWTNSAAKPVGPSKYAATGISVALTEFEEKVPMPFLRDLLPNMQFDTKVYLGSLELNYEYKAEGRSSSLYDNNY